MVSDSKQQSSLTLVKARFLHHCRHEAAYIIYHWRKFLLAIIGNYWHSVATNIAYYNVVQAPVLEDAGFKFFGDTFADWELASEILFWPVFASVVAYMFSPFIVAKPRFYTAQMALNWFLMVSIALFLRTISFLITSLPSPSAHCHQNSPDFNPPTNFMEIIFRIDAINGCGDLIFSSHSTYAISAALVVSRYSLSRIYKFIVWLDVFVVGLLVVALQKHYSVDVWIAWYTVPMVDFVYNHMFPDDVPDAFRAHIGLASRKLHSNTNKHMDDNNDNNENIEEKSNNKVRNKREDDESNRNIFVQVIPKKNIDIESYNVNGDNAVRKSVAQ